MRRNALSPQQVQAMLAGLQLKRLAARTIRGVRAVLRAALNDAMWWGLVVRNAAALAYSPKVSRPKITVLSFEDAKKLLAQAEEHPLEAFLCVTLARGLRLGEALGLRWCDVDLQAQKLRVEYALQRVNKKVQLVEPKSDRSRRVVTLPAFAVDALQRHRQRQEVDR